MKTQFKDVPWDVKVAAVFLLAVWVLMCFMAPMVGLALTVGIGTILSIARVFHYLIHGN
jgi:Na+/melibiose symporter-like transporter